VWSLYLTILNAILDLNSDEGKDAFGTQEWRAICTKVREGAIWEEVVRNGYHGVEGDVDADVVINLATILLAHAKTQTLNQKRLENYLAAARVPNLEISADRFSSSTPRRYSYSSQSGSKPRGGGTHTGADTPRDLAARVKILELYTLHVLPRNGEWDYAREFINMSAVLDDERREAFLQALDSLKEEQEEAERIEREEHQKREEAIRRDIENARRLRAENEERERKRLEEERLRREREAQAQAAAAQAAQAKASKATSVASTTTETDYGIDRVPTPNSVAGSSKGRSKKPSRKSSQKGGSKRLPRHPLPPSAGGGGGGGKGTSVATPTLGTRAALMMSNLRHLAQQVRLAFESNPFLLYRTIAFIVAFLLLFSRKKIRERIQRILGTGWGKIKATAGMGTKVSYI